MFTLDRRLVAAAVFSTFLADVSVAGDRTLVEIAPADTLFYASIDVERAATDWEKLDLVRLYRDAEVQAFLAPALQAMTEDGDFKQGMAVKFLVEQYGFPTVIDGTIEIAVVGYVVHVEGKDAQWRSPASPFATADAGGASYALDPELVMLIDTAGQESFGSAFERLLEIDPRIAIIDGEDGGVPYHVASLPEEVTGRPYTTEICYTFLNDRFVAAMRPSRLVETVNALKSESAPSSTLASDPSFQRWRSACVRGTEIVEAYIGLKALMPAILDLARSIGGDSTQSSVVEALGAHRIEGLGMRIGFDDGRLSDSYALIVPQQRTGVLRILDALQPGAAIVESVRDGAVAHFEARVDPALVLDVALESLSKVDADARTDVDDGLKEISEKFGFDIRSELIASLGADLVISAALPKSGYIPEVIGSIELRDAAKFQALLPKLRATIASESSGEVTTADLALKDGEPGFYLKLPGSVPVAPSFAVRNDRLWMSLTTAGLKRIVAGLAAGRPAGGGPSADLKRCLTTSVGQDVGSISGMFYLDLKSAAEFGLATAEPFLPLALQQAPVALDAAKFPSPETIGSYLSGILYTLRLSDGVVAIDGSSPFGGITLQVAGMAAIAFQQERQRRSAELARFEQQRAEAEVVDPNQPFVGILHDSSQATGGVRITGLTPGSPAEQAGLLAGDLILAIDNETVTASVDLTRILHEKPVGKTIVLTVEREDSIEDIEIVIAKRGDYIR